MRSVTSEGDRRETPARIVRELSELRRALDESAIVAVTDADGVILHVNDRFCAVSGYSREELVGQTHRVVASGEHPPSFFQDLWATILSGAVWRGRIQNRRKDGSPYWVETTITPLFGAGPRPERFLAVRHDVTELVRATQARVDAERRLEAVFDNAAVGVAVVDLSDRFVLASATLGRMLRASREELARRPFTDFTEPGDVGLDRELFRELVDGAREHYRIDRRYRRGDGTSFLGHTTVSLVRDDAGRPDYVIGVIEDVTEVRANEQRARERGALARLGEMSAVIAHEVRNPLAGILGAVEIIGRSLPEAGPERDAIESVVRRIGDLDELLTQILVFARPRPPRPARVSLRPILEHARDHAAGITFSVTGDENVTLFADAALLERALANLVVNAAQAGAQSVRASVHADEETCTIELVDDGPGIGEEHASRIFEPFFTTKSRGAGLGLAIARAAVEAHGGTLALARSAPGATAMRVVLPLSPSAG
ncbi:MAG: PAS domain S-box protein [Sandaracinaceae bacterium]|nr:PAS domain S-box protein [Sandaracinaceae bacterium]